VLVAIDAATELGSVAVGAGGELGGEVVIGTPTRHAEALLPALDFLLRTVHLERAGITGVVVGAGPGSFTGVRVAAATARGLAQGLGVPLYAYSSLAAAALTAGVAGPVCVLFDARRGEVYAGCYTAGAGAGRLTTVMEPVVVAAAELPVRLASVQPWFAGSGAERYAHVLGYRLLDGVAPRASALLRLAAGDPAAGLVAEPAGWEPSYLRASGAERGVVG
jgi:tRNA threonylcarbamoyladenosine biosynthesis protein TsaB